MPDIPTVAKEDLPPCHAEGENPEGYDASDLTCGNCPDKFTCLPLAIDAGLIESALSDDIEVDQVLNDRMTYDEAVTRMQMRQQKIADQKPIPKDLSLHPEDVEDEDESEEQEPEEQEPELDVENGSEEESPSEPKAKKKTAKKKAIPKKKAAPKKKVAKKKAAPKKKAMKKKTANGVATTKAKPKKKPAKKKPVKKKKTAKATEDKPKRRPKGTDSKDLPKPRAVTEEQMLRSMGKIRLGMPIDLDYGMSLVRKNRDGTTSIVTITKQGYEHDGLVYGSLSAAAMVASDSPFRSGNDFFNLVSSGCTEVRDENGKVIAKKGMLTK